VKSLSKETLELVNENSLASMTHAIKAGGQLACYAAIAMTTVGARLVYTPLIYYSFLFIKACADLRICCGKIWTWTFHVFTSATDYQLPLDL